MYSELICDADGTVLVAVLVLQNTVETWRTTTMWVRRWWWVWLLIAQPSNDAGYAQSGRE
jgi:hypothetical protein